MNSVDRRVVSRMPVGAVVLVLALLAALSARVAATALETGELPVGEFHRVHFSGSGTLHVHQAAVPRLMVRGPAAALAQLRVTTRDGALHIDAQGDSRDLVIDLQVAQLSELISDGDGLITGAGLRLDSLTLEGRGAGSFDIRRLEARRLAVRGRGTARFDVTGQVDDQAVDLAGSAAYRAGELISEVVRVSVSGASDAQVWADRHLDVRVAGAASVQFAGAPQVRKQVSGVARLERLPGIVI